MMRLKQWAALILAALILSGCEPIADPWVPGRKAEALEAERTRGEAQEQVLRDRLRRYGDAYQ